MKKTLLILFAFAVFFCLPFFVSIPYTFPRLYSDYDAVLPIYQYIGTYFRIHLSFPSIIPFVAGGIPILGDPVTGMFDPFVVIPLMFFNINISIRLTMFLVIFSSGITMYLLLVKLKVSRFLQYWGSFLYMSSGIIIACISAGHITEKFLSIPLIPLLFLFELERKISLKRTFLLSLVIAATVYCGDLYASWFFFIFLSAIEGFYFIRYSSQRLLRVMAFIGVILGYVLLAAPQLYPFLVYVLPNMRRPTLVNPFLGSVHFFLLPLQFLVPFQVNFFERPFFQRHLGFYYNWIEYYGFLGFFPIFFLKNIKRSLKDVRVQIFLVLIFIGSLYLASKFVYSPFHWLFVFWKGTTVFRVPQRIVIPLTPVVISLFCLLAMQWKKKMTLYAITTLSILWTVGVGWFTFSQTFVPFTKDDVFFVQKFAEINKSHQEIANFIPFIQYFLVEENIPIHNYYYAWDPKSTIQIDDREGNIYKGAIIKAKIPYILSTNKLSFRDSKYKQVMNYKNYIVWERNY